MDLPKKTAVVADLWEVTGKWNCDGEEVERRSVVQAASVIGALMAFTGLAVAVQRDLHEVIIRRLE